MSTTPTPQPGILDQLKQTGSAIVDALKAKYLAGHSPAAPLSAGPGSVLDQRDQQIQPLLDPMPPLYAAPPLMTPQPPPTSEAYGTRPGEKRVDVSEYQKPLGGLSGVRRSK